MKQILQQLYNGQSLSFEEAKAVLKAIASNEYNSEQVAAFLSVFNMRSVKVEEFAGFRAAMLELCVPINLGERVMDLCGTGGDGKDTFNISTLSSFVAAAAGVRVAKHGNKSVSSKCGSSNVLQALGIEFQSTQAGLKAQLEKAGICFLHAPLFHPAMANVAPVRNALGVKTFFNMLGPLVNPARPQAQIAGVFNADVARLYYYLLQNEDSDFGVVYDLSGYDEISLTGSVKVFSQQGEQVLQPSDFGLEQHQASDLYGGESVEASAEIFTKILQGDGTKAQNQVVAANAGLAISTYKKIDLKQGVEAALDIIQSQKALKVLNNLVK